MNKKANMVGIISIVVSSIIIVVFLAGWIYFFNNLNDVTSKINIDTNIVNFTDAASKTIAPVNNAMSGLNYISFILIFMLILACLIENYYVRRHPIMIAIHLLIVILAVVSSLYISNQAESLLGNSIISSQISQQSGSVWILLNLPYIIAVIGLLGMFLMFINLNRDPEIRATEI